MCLIPCDAVDTRIIRYRNLNETKIRSLTQIYQHLGELPTFLLKYTNILISQFTFIEKDSSLAIEITFFPNKTINKVSPFLMKWQVYVGNRPMPNKSLFKTINQHSDT